MGERPSRPPARDTPTHVHHTSTVAMAVGALGLGYWWYSSNREQERRQGERAQQQA